jgi:hypothetical protein
MLTDGYTTDEEGRLTAVLKTCEGHFVCDCRGVGDGWRVEELRNIAHALLGTWKPVAAPEQLADDFRAALRESMAKRTPGVVLRIRPTKQSRVTYFAQTMPSVENLTGKGVTTDGGRVIEFPLGPWGAQSRDYHLRLEARQDDLGIETGGRVRAAHLEVIVPAPGQADGADRVAVSTSVAVRWTTDRTLAGASNTSVNESTYREELTSVVELGLIAWQDRRPEEAERLLGRAVQLASWLGHKDMLELLSAVATFVDPKGGVIRLRPYNEVPPSVLNWTRYHSTQSRTLGPDAGDLDRPQDPAAPGDPSTDG